MWKKIPPGTTSAPGATSASGIWTVDPDWGCPLWRDELNRANAHFPSTGMNAVGFLPTWRGASAHRRLPSRAMAATHRAWKSTSIVRPGASTTRTTAPPTAEGGSRASFPSSEGRALSLMMRMDLNKTVGGTRLTLYANLPKGQKITTYRRMLGSRRSRPPVNPSSRSLIRRNSGHRGVRHGGTARRRRCDRSHPLCPVRHRLPESPTLPALPTKQKRRCLALAPYQRPPPGYRASPRKARLRSTAAPSRRPACARTAWSAAVCSTPRA